MIHCGWWLTLLVLGNNAESVLRSLMLYLDMQVVALAGYP